MNTKEREQLWHDRLAEVSDFYNKHGRNPSSKIPEEATLASWFTMQRVRLRSGNMREDRSELLDAKLPHWSNTSSRSTRFEEGVEDYLAFVAENGRAPVSSADDKDERRIAIWMSNQKAQFRRGEAAEDAVAILNERIPGWNVWQRKKQNRAGKYPTWDESLESLRDFINDKGVKPVFECDDDDERRLAAWLNNQRRIFRKGKMSADRVAKLNETLPEWNDISRNDGKWDRNLKETLSFIEKNNHVPSISGETADERRLGRWFSDQKRKAAAGELEDRAEAFAAAIPDWETAKAPTNVSSWEETLESTADYYNQYGTFPATTSEDPETRRMGFWMTRNRKYLKDGRLTSERLALLNEKIPNWRRGTGRSKAA